MKKIFFVFLLIISKTIFAQDIYPTNWWTGMKWNKVQLMVHSTNDKNLWADKSTVQINFPGVKLLKVHKPENRKYVFLDLEIAPTAKPGMVKIDFLFSNLNEKFSLNWELKPRRNGKGTAFAQGATSSDIMYLIMPDRFSNGDYSNDRIAGMRDQSLNRDSIYDRHGGDLIGVQNHLDYLKDLGVTAIWLNPIWENDMPRRTEHGYAFTNHYKVDARLGGNAAYKNLIDAAHAKGLKIIQDAVYNHIGSYHFTVTDPPMNDWLHQWKEYTNTHYKDQALFDPYASAIDKKTMADGWFTKEMPDVNQGNAFAANFLIQHALWSVEEFGIDGWRIDTYAYNDLDFMNRCNKALYDEYPSISIFGETWVHGVINQSYFCENNFNIPYKSNLQATTDFQTLFYGIQPALTQNFGWTEGLNKLYTTAAQDFVYKTPMRQVIFLDNHDLPRFYSVLNEDTAKYKAALAWLMTFRGIPQLYYGNEILMTGFTNPDGWVRLDFKGGWKEDKENKFTAAGRTEKENIIFNYLKKLMHYRNQSSAIKTGKLMQYLPEDGVYVYFRYDDKQTVLCVINQNETEKEITPSKYEERTKGYQQAKNIIDGSINSLKDKIKVPAKSTLVLEFGK